MAWFRCGTAGNKLLPIQEIPKHTYRFTCSKVYYTGSAYVRDLYVYLDGTLYTSGRTSGSDDTGGPGNLYIRSEERNVLEGAYDIRFNHSGTYDGKYKSRLTIYINEFNKYQTNWFTQGTAFDTGDITFS